MQNTCLSCGKEMQPWLQCSIDAKKNSPSPYSKTIGCCGSGRIDPLPSHNEVAEFYQLDSYYTHGESHIRPVKSNFFDKVLTKIAWKFDKGVHFSVERIASDLHEGARICDLGCGHAQYLKEFQKKGFEVLGIEPDPSARALAKEAGVTVLDGTAENIPDDLGEFDLVIFTHALEHCIDPVKAMRNAHRLTKNGGLCYIEVPNSGSKHFEIFNVCSENFDAPRHMWFFTSDALSKLARSAGFQVKKELYGGYTRLFSPSWRAWEREIFKRIRSHYPNLRPKEHTYASSVVLLLKSFWLSPSKKYDIMGQVLKK